LGALRPDLVVIRHEPSKSVVICDVTVLFENRWTVFEDARGGKSPNTRPWQRTYSGGGRVIVPTFVIGALGSWNPRNETVLRLLRVGNQYAAMMQRLIGYHSLVTKYLRGARVWHPPTWLLPVSLGIPSRHRHERFDDAGSPRRRIDMIAFRMLRVSRNLFCISSWPPLF